MYTLFCFLTLEMKFHREYNKNKVSKVFIVLQLYKCNRNRFIIFFALRNRYKIMTFFSQYQYSSKIKFSLKMKQNFIEVMLISVSLACLK